MMSPVNLASRPVRNERLPALLFALATVLLLGATVQHAVFARRLWPRRSAALRDDVQSLRKDMQDLRMQSGRARMVAVSAPQKAEWKLIRDLVDKRTFWWSELFASFEEVLPEDVKIVSMSPTVKEGQYHIELMTRVQSKDSAFRFVRQLEDRPEFADVYLMNIHEDQGAFGAQYTMKYVGRGSAPAAASAPAPKEQRP
jgi:Tfp pilus assembly protein PilN